MKKTRLQKMDIEIYKIVTAMGWEIADFHSTDFWLGYDWYLKPGTENVYLGESWRKYGDNWDKISGCYNKICHLYPNEVVKQLKKLMLRYAVYSPRGVDCPAIKRIATAIREIEDLRN